MGNKEQRWLGIGGLVFVGLLVIVLAVVPSPPDINASAAQLAAYYTKSREMNFGIAGFLTMGAVVLGAFWFWYFRELLAGAAKTSRLATVAFAGAVIFATGGGLSAGLYFVLSDAAGKAAPATIEVLHYLFLELVLGLTASGVIVFLLATALLVIRHRVLPVWLGWVAAVFALASFAITPVAVICVGLWMVATNVVLIAGSRTASGTPVTASV